MMQQKDFDIFWPRATIALTHLGVTQEHMSQIRHYNIADYTYPPKAEGQLFAFVLGSRGQPVPVILMYDESSPGDRKSDRLVLSVKCEAYEKPLDDGSTHRTVDLHIHRNRCAVVYGRSHDFTWPYVMTADEPVHEHLAELELSRLVRKTIGKLFKAKPEDLPKLEAETEAA